MYNSNSEVFYSLLCHDIDQQKKAKIANINTNITAGAACALLKNAHQSVIILCNKLSGDVFGSSQVAQELRKAYQRNPNLDCRIFVREAHPELTEFTLLLILHHAKIITNVQYSDTRDIWIIDGKHTRIEQNEASKEADIYINDTEKAASALKQLKTCPTCKAALA